MEQMEPYVSPLYLKEIKAVFYWYAFTVFCKFIYLTFAYYMSITETVSQY